MTIEIDTPTIISQKADYKKVVALCEKGKYSEAKPILKNLTEKNPTNSEYHRIMGQILSDEGDQEEAINCLIDALRWDPKNGYGLIMMGNIFARNKGDMATAIKYYNEAIAQNPNDHIAINNLGTNLLKLGKWEEGMKYLENAYEINSNYPNTLYGLALANEHLGNVLIAFEWSVSAMKKCGKNDTNLFNHALKFTLKTAEEFVKTDAGKKVFNEYKSYLEIQTDKSIKVEVDNSISTAAKIEFAENYNRDYHLIKYKEKYLAVEHLMLHELVHLDFVHEA
ncbi:MAG TPA: tetratricopeptide repeat protein [Chitinophagaceae bacterium]|nr:tetratricopeptide repeat protein [Chitinophagaceae bacterium]